MNYEEFENFPKELKIQPAIDPQTKNFSYAIYTHLQCGQSPMQICQQFCITPQRLQYHLTKLKRVGAIRKLGYGTWEVVDHPHFGKNKTKKTSRVAMNDPHQSNLYLLTQDAVRAHAFVFTLKVPENLRNWNNEMREVFLQKKGISFTNLTAFGGGQRILCKGRKIWLTNKSVIVYEKSSYLAETADQSKSNAIHNFISLVKGLERLLHADFTEHAGRNYRFKVSRQHYALVKNALAKQYDAEGKKLEVRTDNGLWFVIDNSYNLHEAETVHPITADTDNKKVQSFFNSLKDHPVTTKELLLMIQGVTENQQLFALNFRTHLRVLEDLGKGVNEMTALIKGLESFKKFDQSQKTFWPLEEKRNE